MKISEVEAFGGKARKSGKRAKLTDESLEKEPMTNGWIKIWMCYSKHFSSFLVPVDEHEQSFINFLDILTRISNQFESNRTN